MTRHLILGGTGFIARHVAALMLRRGDHVRLMVRGPSPVLDDFVGRDVDVVFADLRTADWPALLDGIDVVHHYAWSTVPSTAEADPVGDLDANVRPTIALLEALRAHGGGRVVFASSGGTVYGTLRQVPAGETHPVEPLSIYGVGKATAERYLTAYRSLHGIDARIARLANPFGVGQSLVKNQGAATSFLHRSLAGEPIRIFGDGSVVRDYVHVADVADGLAALATQELPLEAPHIFNIGTGLGVSLNTIVDILEREIGRSLAVERTPGRRYDVPVSILDCASACQWLGWSPRLTFEEGMRRVLEDLREGRLHHSTLNAEPGPPSGW